MLNEKDLEFRDKVILALLRKNHLPTSTVHIKGFMQHIFNAAEEALKLRAEADKQRKTNE